MSNSWAWLILCLPSIGCAQSIVVPTSQRVVHAGDKPAWAEQVLMTDGVVEAQNCKGELFGFDRIGDLLRNGTNGAALARAAQQFGQEDDITMLTLASVPAEMLHA